MRINGVKNESFRIGNSIRKEGFMSPWVFCVRKWGDNRSENEGGWEYRFPGFLYGDDLTFCGELEENVSFHRMF